MRQINRNKLPTKRNKSSSLNVKLSHPDKLLYPDANITKLDLANYYNKISEWILPYITRACLQLKGKERNR